MNHFKSIAIVAVSGLLLTGCGASKNITYTQISPITAETIPLKNSKITEAELLRWSHLDLVKDTIPGMSVDRAYEELLKNKKGQKVIVAVIDSGTDIEHDDLKGRVWTNTKEVPGNGIDDDKNGYVDDIHGWNFLGNVVNETLELVRILKKGDDGSETFKKAQEKFEEIDEDDDEKKKDFKKAYDYHRLYSKTKDSLLNIDNLKAVEEINTKYQTAEKEKQLLQKEAEAKKKTTTIIILSLLAFFIAIVGFLIYRQQRLKNVQQKQEFELQSAIAQIENQNKLHEQRLAISRDLHDNIGAQLTFIISSVENLKFGFPTMENSIKNHLTKISDFTKTTIVELRDTIWAMNANEFTFDDLSSRIYNFIEKAQSVKENTAFKFSVDESLKNNKFSSLEGVNLYRTIQEAVNNAIKYADATEVSVQVKPNENGITIDISDNGKGFDLDTIDLGNGIVNMQKRIEEIGGVFKIKSELDKGTQITISLNK